MKTTENVRLHRLPGDRSKNWQSGGSMHPERDGFLPDRQHPIPLCAHSFRGKLVYTHLAGLTAVVLAFSCATGVAQESTQRQTIKRGANFNVIEVPVTETVDEEARGKNGQSEVGASYTELASGLNYRDGDRWRPAVAVFESFEGGIAARQGQTKVILSRDLEDASGSVDVLAADGGRMRSSVYGLAYYDRQSGQSVMIAGRKGSRALLVPPNQVVYLDAFEGDVVADLRYTYEIGKFEQDVVLREDPPSPDQYGLDPQTTVLEVWTQFVEAPQVRKRERVLRTEPEGVRDTFVQPDVVDERLDFGAIRMVQGKAFALNGSENEANERPEVKTAKTWLELGEEGTFLIEAVEYVDVEAELERLPKSEARVTRTPRETREMAADSGRDLVGSSIRGVAGRDWGNSLGGLVDLDETMLAGVVEFNRRPGYVLDYITESGTDSNYTFRGDETYYISGPYTLSGATTFQGGAVIKYDTDAYITITENDLTFETETYHPVFFTSKYDGTVGINLTTHGPSMGDYPAALKFDVSGLYSIKHARFRYANIAVESTETSMTYKIWHTQIVNCNYGFKGIHYNSYELFNLLVSGSTYVIDGTSGLNNMTLQHVTADGLYALAYNLGSSYVTIDNSLFTDISITPTYNAGSGNFISTASSAGTYQTVGAGDHYLADSSPHRRAGTGTVNAALRTDLKERTTHPPMVMKDLTITEDITWHPVVPRSTAGVPDRGYHYAAIDYAASIVLIDNGATLTIAPGVAIASFDSSAIRPKDGATLDVRGTNEQRVKFLRYETVQERPDRLNYGNTTGQSHYYILIAYLAGSKNIYVDFADFYMLGKYYQEPFRGNTLAAIDNQRVSNCRFFNGRPLLTSNQSTDQMAIFNNVFLRGRVVFYDKATLNVYNNLFIDNVVQISQASDAGVWTFKDNAFDGGIVDPETIDGTAYYTHNAYLNGADPIGASAGGTDVTIGTFSFVPGPFGKYYLPPDSALIDAGSRDADAAGLYHFTTLASPTKEEDSVVDIGYHNVAVGEGIVGHWAFEEGSGTATADGSGNGLDGTVSGTSWVQGIIGGALEFDGTSNPNAAVADDSALEPADITISLWFKADALDDPIAHALLTKRSSTGNGYFVFWFGTTGTLHFDWGGGGANRWNTGYSPPLDQWVHVALTRNSSGRSLFVNGETYSTTTHSGGTSIDNTSSLRIGLDTISTNYDFEGIIDDVRIYDRSLAPWEVSSLASRTHFAMDTDGDTIPDYIEDANGDGIATGDDTNWLTYNSSNGLSGAGVLEIHTPLE